MADYCSVCSKKLGILSFKYKAEEGSVMCSSCFKKHKQKQEELKRQEKPRKQEELRKQQEEQRKQKEKNMEILKEYISKYLSNKNDEFRGCILKLHNLSDLFDNYSVERARNHFQTILNEAETSNKSGLSSYELDEIMEKTKMCEEILDFLGDLEKLHKLFEKKRVETDYLEIVSIFSEIIADKFLDPVIKDISLKHRKRITKKEVIGEFMKKYPDEDNDFVVIASKFLLEKFNFKYNQNQVEKLIEKIKEENRKIKEEFEIEEFERNLLNPSSQKQKIEIGNFTTLNGYEFEEYLVNLFKILGYTAVQTSLSGDQGADLILSKDDEKIVVQAKKYDGKVSNKAVQEIAAAKNYYDADKAMLVTNSSFTKSAIELAFSNDVELWDGRKLKSVIKRMNSIEVKVYER